MELNMTTLRGILAQVLSVSQDHIVPKQGNWWNPQENLPNIENWCAYTIRSNEPRTAPYYIEQKINGAKVNTAAVQKLATIELQFVGPDSEAIAQSVALWPMRADVKAALEAVQGAIRYADLVARSNTFYQEGNNTVIAWNVSLDILWVSLLETDQGTMPGLIFEGKIRA